MIQEGKSDKNNSPATQLEIYKKKAVFVLIIIAVLALGLLAVNQFVGFRAKMIFLQTPCELCAELNPHLENCIKESSVVYTTPSNFGVDLNDINLTSLGSHPP